jgi:hypothetical protein
MVVPADKLILDISFNNDDSNKSPETMWTTRPFIKIRTFFSSEKFKEIISSTRRGQKALGQSKEAN